MALDSAIFPGDIGFLAKFEEIVLARETLPALNASRPRVIDTAGGKLSGAGGQRGSVTFGRGSRVNAGRFAGWGLNRLAGEVRCGAIHRARTAKLRGNGNHFRSAGQMVPDRGRATRR